MTEALKPCPFCGSHVEIKSNGNVNWIKCMDIHSPCNGSGLGVAFVSSDEAKTITAWNTRADLVDPAAKSLDEHTALAIREAALREAADELYRWGDIYGDNAARSVLALIQVSAEHNDKKERSDPTYKPAPIFRKVREAING